jgi:hypothetical protein
MAQPMKLSILIGADASGAKAGGAEASRALGGVSKAANDAGASINRLIGQSAGLNQAFASIDTRASDIAAYGAQMDALRARYNPMFATINRYKAELESIRAAHKVGAISTAEMTAAISRERQATLASIDTIKGRTAAVRTLQATNRNTVGSFQTANVAAQFQDIAVTSAMGMNPLQIALQQGTQLSAVLGPMGAGGAVRGLASAFTSILSPVSLLTIGVVGLSAAAIQYFTSAESGAEKVNGLLEAQNDVIRKAAAAWGTAAPSLQAYVAQLDKAAALSVGQEAIDLLAGQQLDGQSEKLRDLSNTLRDAKEELSRLGAGDEFVLQLGTAFSDLGKRLESGTATTADLTKAKELLTAATKYESAEVTALKGKFDDLATAMGSSLTAAQKIREEFTKAYAGQSNIQDIVAGNTFTDSDGKVQYTRNFTAKNPIAPSVNPNNDLSFDPNEEATKRLNAALDENRQRLEQQRDAYRNYIAAQQDSLARLELERSLIGSSAEERARATAVFEADIKAREMGLMLMGRETEGMRQMAVLEAQRRVDLERQVAAYGAVQQAGGTMIDQLTVGTGSLKDRLRSVAETALTTFQQIAVANPLKNMLTGTNLPTLTDLFTGKSASPLSSTTTGAMTVTAGTVMINGVPLGGNVANPLNLGGTTPTNPVAANQNIPADLSSYMAATRNIESGGNYQALGPVTASGDRAYGAYQIMGNNVGPWSQQALGRTMTPQELLADKAAQDAIMADQATRNYARYGNWSDVASVHHSGRPLALAQNAQDQLGTRTTDYVANVNTGMAELSQTTKTATQGLSSLNDSSKTLSGSLADVIGGTKLPASPATQAGFPAAPASQAGGLASVIGGTQLPTTSPNYFPAAPTPGFNPLALVKAIPIFGPLLGTMFGFANGGAFSGGGLTPFATGGVVNSPTVFPMSGGRAGLMGEAGPEAIMPLERGPGGRLGVRASMPAGARQGSRMELNSRHEHTYHVAVTGTGDKELESRLRQTVEEVNNRRDAAMRNSFPDMIEEYRRNPYARYSG